MKKIIVLMLTLFLTGNLFSQNNLFKELEKYQHEEFKTYQFFYSSSQKTMVFRSGYDNKAYKNVVVYLQKNNAGKPMDIDVQEVNGNNQPKEFQPSFRHTEYDHYSEPIYVRGDYKGAGAYLMIEGVLFKIKQGNDDMSSYDTSGTAYVPLSLLGEKKKEATEKPKKKMSFKEKMKAKMAAVKNLVKINLPEKLKSINTRETFKAKIDNYVNEMHVKQRNTPLTAKDKKEIAEMKQLATAEKNKIKKVNDAYWTSEEGQRVLAHDGKYRMTVSNTSSRTVWVGSSSTAFITTKIEAGDSKSVSCTTHLYYYFSDENGSKGTKFYSENSNCGGNVNIN